MEFQLVRLVHLLSLCAFIGSLLSIQLLKVKSTGNPAHRHLIYACGLLDRGVLPVASSLATVTGLLLWWLTRHRSDFEWLLVLLIGWIAVTIVGVAYLAPKLRWLIEHLDKMDDEEYRSRSQSWNKTNAISIAVVSVLFCLAIYRAEISLMFHST